MRLFESIKGRFLICALCILLIPAVIISMIYYLHTRNALKYQIFEDLRAIAESKEQHILCIMERMEIHTIDLSSDRFIRNSVERIVLGKDSKQHSVMQLNTYLSKNKLPLYHSHLIAIVDKYGKVISSTNEKLIGMNMSNQNVFVHGITKNCGEPYIGQPHYAHDLELNCLCISVPVISNHSAELLGVIINTYSLKILNDITINRIGMGNTGEVYLVDKNKIMFTDSRFVENAPFKQKVDTVPVRRAIENGEEMVGIYQDYRCKTVIGSSMGLSKYGWVLLAEMDKAEAFTGIKTLLKTVSFFIGIFGASTVTSVGILFAFLVVKPINELTNATKLFAKGELDYRVKRIRKDEIGELIDSFNTMAEDLKSAHESLRTSEGKYRFLLDSIPQRIFYKDKNSVYVSCSKNYADDLHIQQDGITGKTDYDLYPVKLAEKYRADDKRIMETGQAEDIEEKYIKDGRELFVHTIKIPIKDEGGNVTGILGIFKDVTEKVVLQMEATHKRHLASLGELAAGVGHEINNPINGIINSAQILFNESKEGSIEKDIASRIIKDGDRIASIVQSLLSFTKPGSRRTKKGVVSVEEILSDTFTLAKPQLKKEGIKIMLDVPQKLPKIIADPQQIEQVFLNIISNARYALNQKYPETHADKILEILGEETTINDCPYVKITFYDHGTGIHDNVRDKILDPFYTTKSRNKGKGLGLSISHNIVSDHGGKIIIDSVEGEFTKVVVVLPVHREIVTK